MVFLAHQYGWALASHVPYGMEFIIRISRMSVLVHAQATSQAKPSVNKSTIKDHAAHAKSYEYIEKRRL